MFTSISYAAVLAAGVVSAETIHGVNLFHRHGDRTAKWFGSTNLTALGGDQIASCGDYYRQRYLVSSSASKIRGLSSDVVTLSQLSASVPNEPVLSKTAASFFMGFYPPINTGLGIQKLTNGTDTVDPLNGFQFVLINGIPNSSPDAIWIKGDYSCPAYTTAANSYFSDASYKATSDASAAFYANVSDILEPIMGQGNVTYKYGYDVFDVLNVMSIHNTSVAGKISQATLDTARFLANTHEYNLNYNSTQPTRMLGGSALAGGILKNLATTVSSAGKTKFNFMAGSYNNMMQLFGLLGLPQVNPNFYGLPNYASSFAFELFTAGTNDAFPTNPTTDLMVRFMFRNGTNANLTAFPIFGQSASGMPYGTFVTQMNKLAISDVGTWCGACGATIDFCVAANATASGKSTTASSASSSNDGMGSSSGLSNAAAGGIGAAVTLAVVGVLAGLRFLLTRKRRSAAAAAPVHGQAQREKSGSVSDTSSV